MLSARAFCCSGQATVELLAGLPLLLLLAAAGWQLVLVGHTAWAAAAAASAAARADAIGRSAEAAARERLPEELRRAARVKVGADGDVRVTLRIPRVLGAFDLGAVGASARHEGGA